EQMNKDFRHLNLDTTDIVPAFKGIAGDSKIEFRLANKDFEGNCTNGIDRIFTHEHIFGDANSKLNPWPRNRYLNIWVVTNASSNPGTLAYALKPSDSPEIYFIDGIVSRHDAVGSNGTSNSARARTLSHEAGHWLGLDHPWGGTNSPEVACGNDGIDDTPVTAGTRTCQLNNATKCTVYNNRKWFSFGGVTTNSGLNDPTPIPADSGLISPGFKAVGVSANSTEAGAFSFSNWGVGAPDGATLYSEMTGSIDLTKYYEVTITPVLGYSMKLTDIEFFFSRSQAGVRTYAVRSSINNYGSNLAAATAPFTPATPNMSVESGNVFFIKNDTTSYGNRTNIALTNPAYTHREEPVTFRFYGWNAEDNLGAFKIDSVTIKGTHGIIENIQNIMDYSFCHRMFTKGQGAYMRTVLNSTTANRNNLWASDNHVLTGIDAATPVVCAPESDFFANTRFICAGEKVVFKSVSKRAKATTYAWAFQDGTPATATTADVDVSFSGTGWKKVTLTQGNAKGSDKKEVDQYVFVSPGYGDIVGPHSETFDGQSAQWWVAENPNEDQAFELVSWGANNKAFGLVNIIKNPYPGYYSMLGGRRDGLISPSYNLHFATGAKLTFKYSCATKASLPSDITERLVVYSSIDCGKTWSPRKNITGTALTNAGLHEDSFVPSSENHWKTESLTISSAMATGNVRFKFEYTSSDRSNNIYLDDIEVSIGNVGIDEIENEAFGLNVFPNPNRNGQILNLTYTTQGNAKINVADVLGKVVYTYRDQKGAGEHTMALSTNEVNMGPGVYFITISDGNHTQTKKVIIY
nr:T9SS type A sorting domain-containing protein [Bacteroidota bacterium]